jgi:integrase
MTNAGRQHMSIKYYAPASAREIQMLTEQVPRAGAVVSFGEAARHYCRWKGIDLGHPEILKPRQREDAARIHKLVAALGKERLANIAHATFVATANKLHGHHTAQNRNREVMTPAAAILHYASRNGWCAWLRVDPFKQPKPKTRAATMEVASALLEAAPPGPKRLPLLWLFRQGTQLSDTLKIAWPEIDLTRGTVRFHIGKTDTWTEPPLAAEMVEALAAIPKEERTGRLFPRTDKLLARPCGCARAPRAAV